MGGFAPRRQQRTLARCRPAARGVRDTMDASIAKPRDLTPRLLYLDGVSVSFDGFRALNNLALDITEYVEMDNFLKYSRAVQQAQTASNNGEKMVQVDMPAEKYVSAMLKFPGMRIYGCDNA